MFADQHCLIKISLFLLFFLVQGNYLSAQERRVLNPVIPPPDTSSMVKVKNADNFIYEKVDDVDYQYFSGNVKMFHDSIYMYADSAVIRGNQMTARGEVIIIQDDTINVFSDSLIYDADFKMAKLFDEVVVVTGDKQLFTDRLDYDLNTKIGTFRDTAILRRASMTLSSLKGYYNLNDKKAHFYDQVVIKDEDFELTADSLDYDTDIDRAYFKGSTYIIQSGKQVYCEAGYYDMISKQAFFSEQAVIVEGSKVAFADDILVSEQDSSVKLTGNAEVKDSLSTARGESIFFDDKKGDIRIEGKGYYEKDDQIIEAERIDYNTETEDFYSVGNSTISGKKGILAADSISYVKVTDLGQARGNASFRDTVDDRTILADYFIYKDSSSYVQANAVKVRPLFIQRVDEDTLYVAADTLISAEPYDSLKYLKAISDVMIFKSDLQAVCDSMYFDNVDSTFTLFRNPICWSDTTQFSGDTIDIVLRNEEVREIVAKKKAFIATRHLTGYFDQIKGKYLHSYLDSNELKRMLIKGNAEALYFIKDDKDAYVGANKTLCSHMAFYFDNEELDNIKFYTEPESTMTPMAMAKDALIKLEGLRWEVKRRPIGVEGMRLLKYQELPVVEETEDDFEAEVLKILEQETDPAPSHLGAGKIK